MKTRDFILQKTFGLLLEKGYDGVSVSDIQQGTEMARGLLYHYFGGQNALFDEAVEKYLNDWFYVEREAVRNKSVGELIVITLDGYRRIGSEISEIFQVQVTLTDVEMLFFEVMRHNRDFAVRYRTIRENRFAVWKTALLNSFSAGELRSGLNLSSVARQFIYIIDGVVMDSGSTSSLSEAVYEIEKELRGFFELIRR